MKPAAACPAGVPLRCCPCATTPAAGACLVAPVQGKWGASPREPSIL